MKEEKNLVFLLGWGLIEPAFQKLIKLAPTNYKVFIPSHLKINKNATINEFNLGLTAFLKENI